jgi:phosphoribosylaminoimidazolecarboxamide formyltransferase/IMP cyclohydrolase
MGARKQGVINPPTSLRRKGRIMTDIVPIRRALLSVSDKTGLVDLGKSLAEKALSWFRPAARPRRCAMPVWM